MSLIQGVGIEEFQCIQRCPHFKGGMEKFHCRGMWYYITQWVLLAFSPTSFSETLGILSHYSTTVFPQFFDSSWMTKFMPITVWWLQLTLEKAEILFSASMTLILNNTTTYGYSQINHLSPMTAQEESIQIEVTMLLNRRSNAVGPTGLFTCGVLDRNGVNRKIYIGVNLGISVLL